MADAHVYPVEPGSLIVLRGVQFDEISISDLMDGLERAAGHRRFVVLQIDGGGDAIVLGPEELVGWLKAALGFELDLGKTAPTPKEYDLGRVNL
jgi:hypothetical protein